MKIAVASDKAMVAQHFGHCESFIIFNVENNQAQKSETIPNPGHKPGFLPAYLNEMGVNVIISGGMGEGAVNLFNQKGIEVIIGTSGNSEDAANSFVQGNIKSNGSVCEEHGHHHEHQHQGKHECRK